MSHSCCICFSDTEEPSFMCNNTVNSHYTCHSCMNTYVSTECDNYIQSIINDLNEESKKFEISRCPLGRACEDAEDYIAIIDLILDPRIIKETSVLLYDISSWYYESMAFELGKMAMSNRIKNSISRSSTDYVFLPPLASYSSFTFQDNAIVRLRL